LLTGALLASGCATDKPFAKVNGQVITKDEYVKALERQQVVVPGGQPTNAERLVIDQLIDNKVLLAEAAKVNAVPTEDEVNRYYDLQKRLFEGQYPGKGYETSMKEMGTSPEELKADMKVQLAKATLFSRRLGIGDNELRQEYDTSQGLGLPARVQLRFIIATTASDLQTAKKLLDAKTPFEQVAKQVNPPQLKATAGLWPQAMPINSIGLDYQSKVQQSAEGVSFGPVDFRLNPQQPPAKAWVKIEKKLPAYTVNFEDAVPLVRRQLVEKKLALPESAKIRDEIMLLKLKAKFEPTDPNYGVVWDSLRKSAQDAGVGRLAAAPAAAPLDGGSLAPPAENAAPPAAAPAAAAPAGGAAAPGPKGTKP
jgi:hypothetical protein